MIKFFRKIRQNMIRENKFSKYLLYAIGEIVLVVIGIIIALQVNNWNNERLDKHKAQLLMNRLITNLQNDQKLMDTMSKYYVVVKKYSINAIDGYNETSSVSDEQFVIAA